MNIGIIGLYLSTAARYALAGTWPAVCYWLCAAGITATVTFLYNAK